jgi:hypothetical protein
LIETKRSSGRVTALQQTPKSRLSHTCHNIVQWSHVTILVFGVSLTSRGPSFRHLACALGEQQQAAAASSSSKQQQQAAAARASSAFVQDTAYEFTHHVCIYIYIYNCINTSSCYDGQQELPTYSNFQPHAAADEVQPANRGADARALI